MLDVSYTWNGDTRQSKEATRVKIKSPSPYLYTISTPLNPLTVTGQQGSGGVVMGALDYLSSLCECGSLHESRQLHKLEKRKQLQVYISSDTLRGLM